MSYCFSSLKQASELASSTNLYIDLITYISGWLWWLFWFCLDICVLCNVLAVIPLLTEKLKMLRLLLTISTHWPSNSWLSQCPPMLEILLCSDWYLVTRFSPTWTFQGESFTAIQELSKDGLVSFSPSLPLTRVWACFPPSNATHVNNNPYLISLQEHRRILAFFSIYKYSGSQIKQWWWIHEVGLLFPEYCKTNDFSP